MTIETLYLTLGILTVLGLGYVAYRIGSKSMWFLAGILTMAVGLTIGMVAAYFSIFGLMALFAAASGSVALMGATLETGKMVLAAVCHYFWKKLGGFMKFIMAAQLSVLMIITSIGIFGYLTQAHMKHGSETALSDTNIDKLTYQKKNEEANIANYETQIADLRKGVFSVMKEGYVKSGLKANEAMQKDVDKIQAKIEESRAKIDAINSALAQNKAEKDAILREIGPLKYVAAIIWQDSSENGTDKAVILMTLLIMFVFDPFAILMVIVGTMLIHHAFNSVRGRRAHENRVVRKKDNPLKKVQRVRPKPVTFDSDTLKTEPMVKISERSDEPGLTGVKHDVINVATTTDGRTWGKTRIPVLKTDGKK